MVAPVVTAAAIGAGANLLGGMLGSSGSRHAADVQRDLGLHAFAHDTAWRLRDEQTQREFAQHGVRWRTEDAIAAGLHPLFALSGAGATFSPSPSAVNFGDFGSGMRARGKEQMGDALARAGQDIARAVAAGQTTEQRQRAQMELQVMAARAENDIAQASYWRSKANDIGNPGAAPLDIMQGTPNVEGAIPHAFFFDRSRIRPSDVFSRSSNDPATAAGTGPFWRSYQLTRHGFVVDLPWSEEGPSETMQDMPMWFWPVVVRHNVDKYGASWLGHAVSMFPGIVPLREAAEAAGRAARGAWQWEF